MLDEKDQTEDYMKSIDSETYTFEVLVQWGDSEEAEELLQVVIDAETYDDAKLKLRVLFGSSSHYEVTRYRRVRNAISHTQF